MSFDDKPEFDEHHECAHEIALLKAELERLKAELERLKAELVEAMAELSEQESRANRWMTGCQLAREQLAEARLALRLIDIEGVDQRVRDVAQAALEVKDNG